MPAKSKAQQKAAGAALAAKRGETKKSALKGASRGMAASMTEKELRDLAKTKRKTLPARKAAASKASSSKSSARKSSGKSKSGSAKRSSSRKKS